MAKKKTITAYKGFNQDLTCRGFQYEVGATYKHDGEVVACPNPSDIERGAGGFHACEHPLDVFRYYPPSSSRFAVVEMAGETARHGGDTKIASAEITIRAELKLPEIIQAAVKYVFDRANWSDGPVATEDNEGALASGDQGAATASGYQGAATASGDQGAATASGDQGAVSGAEGNALFLVERICDWGKDHGKIINVWAGIAGRDGIKPDTFYRLVDGKPVEVSHDQQD